MELSLLDIGSAVAWKNLKVGGRYYQRITGFNPLNPNSEFNVIVVKYIQVLNADESEAMIYADLGRGYGVGGIFEGDIGPQNRFWTIMDLNASLAATAA